MIGATAKANQYRERAGSHSTKGSSKGFSLLGEGISPVAVLNSKERMQNLRAAIIRGQLLASDEFRAAKQDMALHFGKDKDLYFSAKRRRDKAKAEIQLAIGELTELKLVKGYSSDPRDHFIDICRETMTLAQFKIILAGACNRAKLVSE